MHRIARIAIVTDRPEEAANLQEFLRGEFDQVSIDGGIERAAKDFDMRKPEVVVLLFASLNAAQDYFAEVLRNADVLERAFRTLLLCQEAEGVRACELCIGQRFDDYLLFRLSADDRPRLLLALHQALDQMRLHADLVLSHWQITSSAKRLAELEPLLERGVDRCETSLSDAARALQQASQDVNAELESFSDKVLRGALSDAVAVKDPARFRAEFGRCIAETVGTLRTTTLQALQPLHQWGEALLERLPPYIGTALARNERAQVLMIDDDEFQHKLMLRLLPTAQYDLVVAGSAAEAFAAVRQRRPDVILLDVSLPDLPGVEVARRLRNSVRCADTPIIMITGNAEQKVVVESRDAGANDFLVKPLDKDVLLRKLGKVLGAVRN